LCSKAAGKNGHAGRAKPTKHFIDFLVADLSLLAGVEAELSSKLGEIDARGTTMARQESKFCREETGRASLTLLWSLQSLRSAGDLVAVKLYAQTLVDKFRDPASGGRRVNLDPGYLDALKVVLVRRKNANQRIYLTSGITQKPRCFITTAHFTDCRIPIEIT
jgi:hypothetical protein